MAQTLQYQCPCCGGAIEFNSTSQKMVCPWCDTEYEPEALSSYDQVLHEQVDDQLNWETKAGEEWQEGETEGLHVYTCSSCGGEIVTDEVTGATACPWCDNPVVVTAQFAGALKPDFVIPFKLDKKAAMDALKKHYSGKRLLPKVFCDENHIEEVKGIYVPFWLFDADAEANIRYRATRTRIWSDSRYNYTEVSHFAVLRGGAVGFERVPVDGSSKMEDALMESIEPYDFSEVVPFQTAYLSGFLADKYDVDADASIERANERIKKSTEEVFADTVHGYHTVVPENSSIRLQNGTAKYALYPVWLLNTKWNGNTYTFAMNGQTGKLVGDLPLDKAAYRRWLFGISAIAASAIFALQYLLWLL